MARTTLFHFCAGKIGEQLWRLAQNVAENTSMEELIEYLRSLSPIEQQKELDDILRALVVILEDHRLYCGDAFSKCRLRGGEPGKN